MMDQIVTRSMTSRGPER